MSDRDDLKAVAEEMRTLASASKLMPETLHAWADRLDGCITSTNSATNSGHEPSAEAVVQMRAYAEEAGDSPMDMIAADIVSRDVRDWADRLEAETQAYVAMRDARDLCKRQTAEAAGRAAELQRALDKSMANANDLARRLEACITSDKPATNSGAEMAQAPLAARVTSTNSEVEAVAHAIDNAIYPADPWAADTDEAPQPRTVAEVAIAALDAFRRDDGKTDSNPSGETARLREALEIMADPSAWHGNPLSSECMLYGHFTPFELARAALSSS